MRLCWIAFVAFATVGGADARFASAAEPEMHYAPVENLEHIDLALIRSATKSLDMAMYTLTDWAIIAALKDARVRGVTIRIALDPSVRQAYDKLADMADCRAGQETWPVNAPQSLRDRWRFASHRVGKPQSKRIEATR
jgi:hypothetical protein